MDANESFLRIEENRVKVFGETDDKVNELADSIYDEMAIRCATATGASDYIVEHDIDPHTCLAAILTGIPYTSMIRRLAFLQARKEITGE